MECFGWEEDTPTSVTEWNIFGQASEKKRGMEIARAEVTGVSGKTRDLGRTWFYREGGSTAGGAGMQH